jgi:hypothetical protein
MRASPEASSLTVDDLADDVFVRIPASVNPARRPHYALPAELDGPAREGDEPAGSLLASTVAVAYGCLVSTSAAATAAGGQLRRPPSFHWSGTPQPRSSCSAGTATSIHWSASSGPRPS